MKKESKSIRKQCDYTGCKYSSRHISHLQRHKMVHIKEKPYVTRKCQYPGCSYETTPSALTKHYQQHARVVNDRKDAAEALMLLHGGKSQYRGYKSAVMVKVPDNVRKNALYAFKLMKLGFQGGKETGHKRAKQLATKDYIPIEDLRYIRNWFSRHVITSYPTYKKWIHAGRPKDKSWHNKRGILSWQLWSANAALNWVNSSKVLKLLNKHFNKNYKAIKEFNKRSVKVGGGKDWMDIDCPDHMVLNKLTGNCDEIKINPVTGRALMPHSKLAQNLMKIDSLPGHVFNPKSGKNDLILENSLTKRLNKVNRK